MSLTVMLTFLLAAPLSPIHPQVPKERVKIHLPLSQALVRVVVLNGYYYYEWSEDGKLCRSPIYDKQGRMIRAEKQNIFYQKPVYIK